MQIIEMLIDAKVNVSAKDANLNTPLHCAARNGRVEVVRYLMNIAYDSGLANKAAENADKKVNENAGRWRGRDRKKKRRNADTDDSDEDKDEEKSYLDEAILHGQR